MRKVVAVFVYIHSIKTISGKERKRMETYPLPLPLRASSSFVNTHPDTQSFCSYPIPTEIFTNNLWQWNIAKGWSNSLPIDTPVTFLSWIPELSLNQTQVVPATTTTTTTSRSTSTFISTPNFFFVRHSNGVSVTSTSTCRSHTPAPAASCRKTLTFASKYPA